MSLSNFMEPATGYASVRSAQCCHLHDAIVHGQFQAYLCTNSLATMSILHKE